MPKKTVEYDEIPQKPGKLKNRREFFRLSERLKVEVHQRATPGECAMSEGDVSECAFKPAEHHTMDISAGGLHFFSNVFYAKQSLLSITVHLKDNCGLFDPIKLSVRVNRVTRINESRCYSVAVDYLNISKKDRSEIERYILFRQRELICERRIAFL
jgi:c-di-GMP-binding flagellar brake protein YcgR